jgi:two-component system LytT family sensor kinase
MSLAVKQRHKLLIRALPVHILIWGLLFFVNFLFINNYRITFDTSYHVLIWSLYIILFYLNYIVLMPFLFFRKRFFFFIIVSLIILGGFQLLRQELDMRHFEKILKTEAKRPETFRPDVMKPPPFDKRLPHINGHGPRNMRIPHFSFYSLFLIYLASISFRFLQKWQDDEKRNREIEKENISTELSFLKQQVNPHFLFNALNSIYSLAINTSKPASEAILKLSSILRYMLYETENKLVDLNSEINTISDYIELQKMRLTENVRVNFEVAGNILNYKIAPLLLLPLIENAFKHGVDNVDPSFIDIMIATHDNTLEMQVKNKMVKRHKEDQPDSGIGIKNIRRRLDLLYPDSYFFDTDTMNDIFTVTLQINFKG